MKKQLIEKGFITIGPSDDPLSHSRSEEEHNLFNEKGEYLGDFLLGLGFEKSEFKSRGKTWISFSNGEDVFTHRSTQEYPTKTFSAKNIPNKQDMIARIQYTEGSIDPRTPDQQRVASFIGNMKKEVKEACQAPNPAFDGKKRFRNRIPEFIYDLEKGKQNGFFFVEEENPEGEYKEIHTPTHIAKRSDFTRGGNTSCAWAHCTWEIIKRPNKQ